MQQLMAEQIPVTVKVESANRGGLLVKYGPYDGFVPVGQFGSVSGVLRKTRCYCCDEGIRWKCRVVVLVFVSYMLMYPSLPVEG